MEYIEVKLLSYIHVVVYTNACVTVNVSIPVSQIAHYHYKNELNQTDEEGVDACQSGQ